MNDGQWLLNPTTLHKDVAIYGPFQHSSLMVIRMFEYDFYTDTPVRWGVLDRALCDQVCQWLVTGRWFSPGTPVSSTNKNDSPDITEILLNVAFNSINPQG
jgi:hypothetical protein